MNLVNVVKACECRGPVPHIIDLHMGLNEHLNCPADLAPGKEQAVPIEYVGWAPNSLLIFWSGENFDGK